MPGKGLEVLTDQVGASLTGLGGGGFDAVPASEPSPPLNRDKIRIARWNIAQMNGGGAICMKCFAKQAHIDLLHRNAMIERLLGSRARNPTK